jgi:hypothetical protein
MSIIFAYKQNYQLPVLLRSKNARRGARDRRDTKDHGRVIRTAGRTGLDLSGAYSRRINIHHRPVYQALPDVKTIKIIRMGTHYE